MLTHNIKQNYKLIIICLVIGAVIGVLLFKAVKYISYGYHRGGDMRMMYDMKKDMRGHKMMMMGGDMLSGKTGVELEKAFLMEMIPHHESAVMMAEKVLASDVRAEVRTLAEAIRTSQQAEIAQMKAWLSEWYK